MAYVKYKELTKYFNFNKEIDIESLPNYVTDYLEDKETIYKAYKTYRDKAIFTKNRMILFDVSPVSNSKKIHVIPYKSISTGAILYNKTNSSIFLSFDSGYQLKLNFVRQTAEAKTELRKLYCYIMQNIK